MFVNLGWQSWRVVIEHHRVRQTGDSGLPRNVAANVLLFLQKFCIRCR